MTTLKQIEGWLVRVERILLTVLVLFMVGLSFCQVVLRVGFSTGILWGDTLGRHLVLWVGFLGAAVAASTDKQFAMDASARLFSGRIKAAVHFVCHAFTSVICVLMAQASVSFFQEEFAQHAALFSVGSMDVQTWVIELILPGGFALLFVHYLIKSAESGCALITGVAPEHVQ